MLQRCLSGCLVLAPGKLPSTDYYLSNRICHIVGQSQVLWVDSREPPDRGLLSMGMSVIIVRHASPAWMRLLIEQRQQLAIVFYLMDDDIPAAWRCRDVPLDYGLWTSWRYWRIRSMLSRICDEWLVSTPELAMRYPGSKLLPPLPYAVDGRPAPLGCRRWGYHGTRVHIRELRWIIPIVEMVQSLVPEAEFEVFGERAIERLFAHIPRVMVRPPLPWPEYVAYCRANPLAVGLAPLLPGRFNGARSHTKAFDILRCGAAGLFSNRPPYSAVLSGSGAILLADEPTQWAQWIIRLLQDDVLRQAKFRQMYEYVMKIQER